MVQNTNLYTKVFVQIYFLCDCQEHSIFSMLYILYTLLIAINHTLLKVFCVMNNSYWASMGLTSGDIFKLKHKKSNDAKNEQFVYINYTLLESITNKFFTIFFYNSVK